MCHLRPLFPCYFSPWNNLPTDVNWGVKAIQYPCVTVDFFFTALVVQLLSHVWLFATPSTVAHQASLSFSITWNLLKLMVIKSAMPSNHFILLMNHEVNHDEPSSSKHVICSSSHFQSFPASGSFLMSQHFASGGQSIGASASASVLPMNTQD